MKKLYSFLGSLSMAVILLVLLAISLAVGTGVEARYGTPAAQHFVYHALWFQTLLLFLAVNLFVSALHRYPWKKRHVGFCLTHLGIIVLLTGNLLGIWFGVEGTLFIPEGESNDALELSGSVLWIQPENPGTPLSFPLDLHIRPWAHDIHERFVIDLEGKPLTVTVDRYFPNATLEQKVVAGGEEFPAVHMELLAPGQTPQKAWLFSRDPERFGFRWGPAHLIFFEGEDEKELSEDFSKDLGTLRLSFSSLNVVREIDVDTSLGKTILVEGTPYTLSLKEYFPDFILTEEGPQNRSEFPNNPALAFTLSGPEGKEAFLVFALHPEFEERHGLERMIPVRATYEIKRSFPPLPPSLIGVVRLPTGWRLVVTSPDGKEKKILPLSVGKLYSHPWLDLSFRILAALPKARVVETFDLKDNDVKRQAVHLLKEWDGHREEGWLMRGQVRHEKVGDTLVVFAYQSAKHPLPFSVALRDFRKKDYPGTSIASAFESDVVIEDHEEGLQLSKTISMNKPFTYRGYTMFQASFVEEPVEATVLSVRKDPGTPLVYAGFVTVVVGVLLMFYLHRREAERQRCRELEKQKKSFYSLFLSCSFPPPRLPSTFLRVLERSNL